MRTTLDLDERVLVAAKGRARKHGTTLGSEISEPALAGLATEQPQQESRHGLVLLPGTPGHTITDEMVADALADA